MGAIGKLYKEQAYQIPDIDRHQVDRLARLFDNMEGMAIQGAAGSSGPIVVPGSPTGNPRFFKLAGETNDARMWSGADFIMYTNNGTTETIKLISDPGYVKISNVGDGGLLLYGVGQTTYSLGIDESPGVFTFDPGINIVDGPFGLHVSSFSYLFQINLDDGANSGRKAIFDVTRTDDGNTAKEVVVLKRWGPSPAAGIGITLPFYAANNAPAYEKMGEIIVTFTDVTAASGAGDEGFGSGEVDCH